MRVFLILLGGNFLAGMVLSLIVPVVAMSAPDFARGGLRYVVLPLIVGCVALVWWWAPNANRSSSRN